MNGDRDELHRGWNTPPVDDPSDMDAAEMTGEFTIDYTPPAWYTQNAGGPEPSSPGAAPSPPAADRTARRRPRSATGRRLPAPLRAARLPPPARRSRPRPPRTYPSRRPLPRRSRSAAAARRAGPRCASPPPN
ncbi:SCO5717 family growth-regulating ATPase [Streptomyces sudanensis]|uniref:SCO5717 family growth-regulating ATPase n=1 Tax=Streptomyces sudanensis TaxID=436397 RepID=UPI0027E48F9C|nr:SCO5717 family growth-regulating ATPase [Streptomyces sudanensis]